MPAARTVKRKPKLPDLTAVVNEYVLNRSMRERSLWHENRLKAGLMEVLVQAGVPDGENGEHLRLDLETPVEFTTFKGERGTKKTVIAIQRQTRTGSMTLSEDRTLAFLGSLAKDKARAGIIRTCLTTVQVINEDAILAANFEGIITDDELKALYEKADDTYAFQLITE